MKIDFELVTDITLDGVEMNDFPDFCDAFIVSAYYDGKPMSEEMLNKINKEHFDFVQESVHEDLDKQELTPAFKNFKEKQLQMYHFHLEAYDGLMNCENLEEVEEFVDHYIGEVVMNFQDFEYKDLQNIKDKTLSQLDTLMYNLEKKELTLEQAQEDFETIGHDIDGASHSDDYELIPAFKHFKAKQKELYELHLIAYDKVLASKNLRQAFQIIEYFMNDLEEYRAFGNIDGNMDEDLKDMIEYAQNETTDMLSDYLKDEEFTLEQVHSQFETIGHDIDGKYHSSEQ